MDGESHIDVVFLEVDDCEVAELNEKSEVDEMDEDKLVRRDRPFIYDSQRQK